MKFSRALVVVRKELTDALRDRRSIYSLLIGSLVGPALIAFMLNRIADQQRGALEIRMPVVGREYAPVLVNWLEQQSGVEIIAGPTDAEAAVRNRKIEFVLVIPKEFPDKFRASRPAPVQVVSDSTRQTSRAKVQRLRTLLARFSAETGGLRLIARGVSPAIASVINVEDVEVSSAQQRAAMVFNMIPMFLVLSAFVAGMQIATDSTAGERERGSLEPLLVNPIPRRELVAGKWLAAVTSSAAGMTATLIVISAVLLYLPVEDLGFRFRFGVPDALLLLAATLPMSLIAPSIQMYLASFAKSFKEAQSYMGYLIFLPMLPGIVTAFYPIGDRPWMAPIPILGQYALSTDIMGGKPPSPGYLLVAAVSAAALALLFVVLTTRLFSKEKIIFAK
jgi:sodium transport system permease protein